MDLCSLAASDDVDAGPATNVVEPAPDRVDVPDPAGLPAAGAAVTVSSGNTAADDPVMAAAEPDPVDPTPDVAPLAVAPPPAAAAPIAVVDL